MLFVPQRTRAPLAGLPCGGARTLDFTSFGFLFFFYGTSFEIQFNATTYFMELNGLDKVKLAGNLGPVASYLHVL